MTEENGLGDDGLGESEDSWAAFDEHHDPELIHEAPAPRRGVRIVAIVTVAAMVLSSAAVAISLLLSGGSRPIEDSFETETIDPTDTDTFDKTVEELKGFVEGQRGLEFIDDVEIELLSNRAFRERIVADIDDESGEIALTERILKTLGLIGPDVNLLAVFEEAVAGSAAGFYDPDDNKMYVRGANLGPYERIVLVHELTHALQDQHFELDRPELEEIEDESLTAFSALREGDASVVDAAYRASLSSAERRDAARREQQLVGGADLSGVPIVVLASLAFPYSDGPDFVEAVLDAGGLELLDRAFEDIPTTSEQILHPDRYLDGEGRLPVDPPVAEGEVFDEGVFGALSLALLVGDGRPTPQAIAAVDGWGGDWSVAWETETSTCVRTTVVVDRPAGYEPLASALESWAERHGDAGVTRDDLGEEITFTACRGSTT